MVGRLARISLAIATLLLLVGCASKTSGDPESQVPECTLVLKRAEPPSTDVIALVTLKNTTAATITWDEIRFGASGSSLSSVPSDTPSGVSVGISTPRGEFGGVPLTLGAKESTTHPIVLPLGPGEWRIVGAYFGNGEAPSGRSAPATISTR